MCDSLVSDVTVDHLSNNRTFAETWTAWLDKGSES